MAHFGGLTSASLPQDQVVLAGVSEHGSWALVHAPWELRGDRAFVLDAVARDGNSLLYASSALRQDKEVVLTAVAQNGHSLRHASEELRMDREFALEAIARSSDAMLFVSADLRNEHAFVLEAVRSGCALQYVPEALRKWMIKREELLQRLRRSVDARHLEALRGAVSDGEAHGLPGSDLEEARLSIAKLVKYSDVGSLWRPLEDMDGAGIPSVVLLKGSWLAGLAERGGRLPRRQDLPAGAAWSGRDLGRDVEEYDLDARERRPHKVVAVSYCWFQRGHPDPDGAQLRFLARLIRRRLEDLGPGVDLAVFLDYCSLLQEPRSDAEEAVFQGSLQSVGLWYAHERTEKWLLTRTPDSSSPSCGTGADGGAASAAPVLPYLERGWPLFERAVAELLTCEGLARSSLLDLGALEPEGELPGWSEVQKLCNPHQGPPRVPEVFCEELARKTFARQADLEMLQEMYAVTFNEVMSSSQTLVFCDLSWGDKEARSLAAAVRSCSVLRFMELEGNCIGDDGAAELMDALRGCTSLRGLVLRANRIGDAGARRVAAGIGGCCNLESVDLSFNVIGNIGGQALASMLESGGHARLRHLRLGSNDIGARVKQQLSDAAHALESSGFLIHV